MSGMKRKQENRPPVYPCIFSSTSNQWLIYCIVSKNCFEGGGPMYFLKSISDDVQFAQLEFRKHAQAKRLVLGSFLACMAAVLQAAGGFLPGIGYLISPFATLP